ncbi:MAG: CCA tRNA nucleotidyltransferase [Vampirovibrio sp.]
MPDTPPHSKKKPSPFQGSTWMLHAEETIEVAQHRFQAEQPSPFYAEVDMNACTSAESLLTQQAHFVVFRQDIERMMSMHLGHLPLRVISVPYFPTKTFVQDVFPALLLQKMEQDGNAKQYEFDMKQQLSVLFPVKFIAALYELQSLFKRFQLKGYLIGGVARDLILTENRKLLIRDVDITVEGQGDKAAQAVDSHSRNFSMQDVYEEFGTAKLQYKDLVMLDFASTRQEVYPHCGALPTITKRGVPLYEDIRRRDFSINTLGLSIHNVGMLYDYAQGLQDLEARRIHVLTGATFFEDPSRILRALKFVNRLDFHLSIQTEWLMQEALGVLHLTPYKGGGARIKESLKEWLSLAPSIKKHDLFAKFLGMQGIRLVMTTFLNEAGQAEPLHLSFEQRRHITEGFGQLQHLWQDVQNNLQDVFQLESPHCDPLDPDTCNERALWYIYLCYLFSPLRQDVELSRKLMHRLELTRGCMDVLKDYNRLVDARPLEALDLDASALQLCQTFDRYESLALIAYILRQDNAKAWLEPLTRYLKRWRLLKPDLTGDDLITLGFPKGEGIGECLKRLRFARITGQVQSRTDEEAFARELMKPSTVSDSPQEPL